MISEIANQKVKISSELKTSDRSDILQPIEAIAPLFWISDLPQSDSHKPTAAIGGGWIVQLRYLDKEMIYVSNLYAFLVAV